MQVTTTVRLAQNLDAPTLRAVTRVTSERSRGDDVPLLVRPHRAQRILHSLKLLASRRQWRVADRDADGLALGTHGVHALQGILELPVLVRGPQHRHAIPVVTLGAQPV